MKDSRSVFALKLFGKIFTIFCTQPPKIGKIGAYRRLWQNSVLFSLLGNYALILPFFGGQVQTIVYFYPLSFNAKTDWLYFLFTMVCKTWYGITTLVVSHHFPKVTKKDCIMSSEPQIPNFSIIGGHVRKFVNFYSQSLYAKTDRLSFHIAMVCESWP